MLGQKMGGCGSVVPWKWNGGWEVTDRLYGAVGENSIDFPRIPYRLFPDTSVQPFGQHSCNDLNVWDNRTVSSVENGAKVRRCGAVRE